MKAKRIFLIFTLLSLVIGLLPADSAHASKKMRNVVSLYTHNLGGTFNVAGVAIAKAVSNKTPVRMLVKPTSGPGYWLPMLNKGEGDIGIANATDSAWAWRGFSEYGFEKSSHIRMLIPGGDTEGSIDLIVRKDSNIKTVADLKGKRVTSEFKGAPICHRRILAQLRSFGLSFDDVVAVPVPDYLSGLRALQDGRVDAAFGGSHISAPNLEINSAIGVRVLPVADTSKPEIAKLYDDFLPGFHSILTKKGGILDKDQLTLSSRLFNLLAYKGLDDDTVYTIVRALYTHYKELASLSARLKSWVPKAFFDPETTVPYHIGTIKYYKEINVWTKAVEKRQAELLSQVK